MKSVMGGIVHFVTWLSTNVSSLAAELRHTVITACAQAFCKLDSFGSFPGTGGGGTQDLTSSQDFKICEMCRGAD